MIWCPKCDGPTPLRQERDGFYSHSCGFLAQQENYPVREEGWPKKVEEPKLPPTPEPVL